jgi:hypothetical protein
MLAPTCTSGKRQNDKLLMLTLDPSIIPIIFQVNQEVNNKVHTVSLFPSKTANKIGGSLLPKG